MESDLTSFLKTLSLNTNQPLNGPRFAEESLASEIVSILHSSEGTVDINREALEVLALEMIFLLISFYVII